MHTFILYADIRIKPGLSYQANVLAFALDIALVLIRIYRIEHFISSHLISFHQKASHQSVMLGHGEGCESERWNGCV